MKKLITCLCLIAFGLLNAQDTIPDFIPGKISVKVNDNYPFFLHEWDIQDSVPLDIHIIGFNELARKAGVTKIEKSHKRLIDRYPVLDNFYKISFSDTFPLDSIVLFLGKNQSLEYVEKIPTARADIVPNDSDYPNNQWGLQKIQPEQAWDKTTGDYKIKIAIVDDGVCIDHCELKTKIWVNQNEIPDDIILDDINNDGIISSGELLENFQLDTISSLYQIDSLFNEIDDDNNGYIDDIFGYDLADNDNYPYSESLGGLFTHGTHVAGISAAETSFDSTINYGSLASIGANCSIIPIKCKKNGSTGSSIQDPFQGVEYAILAGADVINMSWGTSGIINSDDRLMLNCAYEDGILLVSSAGNDGITTIGYPAKESTVISVGNSTEDDIKYSSSNYGQYIDVMAPGDDILSTLNSSSLSGYLSFTGTSMSAPFVSGLCALMRTYCPTCNSEEIYQSLFLSCDSMPNDTLYHPIKDSSGVGYGRINATKSINRLIELEPIADFNLNNSEYICPNCLIDVINQSHGYITGYKWSATSGISISNDTIANPEIQFPSLNDFPFSISLIAYNDSIQGINQTDTFTIVDTIRTPYAELLYPVDTLYIENTDEAYFLVRFYNSNSPYTIQYIDQNGNVVEIDDIYNNPKLIKLSNIPIGISQYTLFSFEDDKNCQGIVSGQVTISRNDQPCNNLINNNWNLGYNAGLSHVKINPNYSDNAFLTPLVISNNVATISDFNGNFLFGTDGEKIWDKTYNLMQNGEIEGYLNNDQGCIVIPKSIENKTYYILNIDKDIVSINEVDSVLTYNYLFFQEIDMNKNGHNGGITIFPNGEVISKNNKVYTPDSILIGNKICSTPHAYLPETYWIITHGVYENTYLVFQSNKDSIVFFDKYICNSFVNDNIGEICFNRTGKILANTFEISDSTYLIQLLSFDNITGELNLLDTNSIDEFIYGLEFSNSGQYLYFSEPDIGKIGRFNIQNKLLEDINYLDAGIENYYSLLLSPSNQEIIVSQYNSNYLGAILNPDDSIVYFSPEFIKLESVANCRKGLPQLVEYNPELFEMEIDSIYDNQCFGINEGAIQLSISGDNPPYSFKWSNGETTEDIIQLTAGFYYLTVSDANACSLVKKFKVKEPDPLVDYELIYPDSLCADNGWATIETNDSIVYYNWSNGSNSQYASDLYLDTLYFVEFRDSTNCNTYRDSFIIRRNEMQIKTIDIIEHSCSSMGKAFLNSDSIINGTEPYNCSWYKYDNFTGSNSTPVLISEVDSITNIAPGFYTLELLDSNECSLQYDFELYSADNGTELSIDNTTCNELSNGYALIDTINGAMPEYIIWSDSTIGIFQLNNLSEGSYWLRTVVGSCEYLDTFSVYSDYSLNIISSLLYDEYCQHSCNAYSQIQVDNGFPPYSVYVDSLFDGTSFSSSYTIDSICPGNHYISIEDYLGCKSDIDSFFVEQANDFEADFIVTMENCGITGNFNINLIVSGDFPPYSFVWSTNDTIEDIVVSNSGTYYVTIADYNDCQIVDTIIIDEYSSISLSNNYTHPTCPKVLNGIIEAIPSGGVMPYSYLWSNGSTNSAIYYCSPDSFYSVTVTDNYGCEKSQNNLFVLNYDIATIEADVIPPACPDTTNAEITIEVKNGKPPFTYLWSTGDTTSHVTGLLGDSLYSVTVTSADDCRLLWSDTIPGDTLSIEFEVKGQGCNSVEDTTLYENASVIASVINGTNTYYYLWSNDSVSDTLPGLIDETRLYVTVTDSLGCYGLDSVLINSDQTIELKEDWSLFSTYLVPTGNKEIHEYFDEQLSSSTILIKDKDGNVFWPSYNIDNIGQLTIGKGYEAKMYSDEVLYLTGSLACPEDNPIELDSGWNYLGYLRTENSAITQSMTSIVDNIILMKDEIGMVYWPAYNIDNIGNMLCGDAYDIKVDSTLFFTYPDNLDSIGTKSISLNTNVYTNFTEEPFINTDNFMVIGIPDESWGFEVEIGDEIAAVGESGQLVGKAIYQGGFTPMVIYGDDQYTYGIIENLADNESFSFQIWNGLNKSLTSFDIKNWETGQSYFVGNDICIAGPDKNKYPEESNLKDSLSLYFTIYPNPNSGQFTMSVYSPANDKNSLFEIVNSKGQIVYQNKEFSIKKGWQTYNLNLPSYSNGIYNCSLISNANKYQAKLVIVK
ncbi:MAG: S8 family serine peptidase [Bacteroidetes bacterium]|jgi:hypothetical protein|nr:S8 family serine peptidase [Bacteroidota bacterium]MBT6685938.1 S8 family serine peptidase [Bacteroidota bacterium]MBT7143353.1 S8 family serine peptidase [Bacteroidota bacterium]MBT7492948.1 S8 family serine peptidase [Bacteroidota bacterium]